MTRELSVILFLCVVCLFCSLGLFAPEWSQGLFALCLLSVCWHEDIIVILSPVSLSVAWDVRVIRVISLGVLISFGVSGYLGLCGYYFRRAFWDGSVIITSVGFDRVRTLHLALIRFALLLPVWSCDLVVIRCFLGLDMLGLWALSVRFCGVLMVIGLGGLLGYLGLLMLVRSLNLLDLYMWLGL